MSANAWVRLGGSAVAVLLISAVVSGCQLHTWSRYSKIPYARWRADDAARLELMREVARGCSDKARRLSRGPGYYQLRMSSRWASKARFAHEAVRVLESSPANPRPGCARILSKIRWQLDYHYQCAVGWVTNLFVRTYVRLGAARRASLLRRIRHMGYSCGPPDLWRHAFLRRLQEARPCLVAGQPTAPADPTAPAGPAPTVTPPPAPGHAPTPSGAPPRKKIRR